MRATETIADSLRVAVSALQTHTDSPRLDAEILLCSVLGASRSALIVRGAEPLSDERRRSYERLIDLRLQGAPVAYLTGSREFWSLELTVNPDVLVPRPETELLVQLALAGLPREAESAVLDLGTGSGAVALAIASERPAAQVTGIDICAAAVEVARGNGRKLGLANVHWHVGAWFDAVPRRRFDLIVANPPYVAADDPALQSLRAEPLLALVPGRTGLEALAAIIEHAPAHLHPGGWLMLEHGRTQAGDVAALLARRGFDAVQSHDDLSGNPRVTVGTVHSSH